MIEFLQNFHFLRPWLLLFFLLPLGLYLKKIKMGDNISSWENICDKNLLSFLLVDNVSAKKLPLKKLMYIGLSAAIISAAGPCWQKKEIPTFSIENPSMFVLSLAQDMQLTDISPSRLERAKFMISDITDKFPQGQFGLEVYSQEPYLITPLTEDIKLIKNLLPQILPDVVPDRGDRLDRAIELAIERFKTAGYTSGNIILFASDVGQRFDFAMDKIKQAKELNYTVNVVDTSFLGNEKLKLLAEKGNGVYLSVKETEPMELINRIQNINQEKISFSQNMHSNYLDYGYYLLIIPILCMLPFFRRGVLILVFCCFSLQAQAGFFLNNEQEGFRFFNNAQYDLALDKFKDSLWRGITLYKLDKNEEALKELAKNKSDYSLYNQGVILTKMCQYQEALNAFSKAVELNPQNQDAIYNKKVLDDLFEKAKDDPSVLNCQNDQQQQQQNENNSDERQNQNQDNSNEQNKSEQNNSQNENKENNQDNDSQSSQNNEKQNPEKEDSSQSADNTSSQQQSDNDENSNESDNNNDDNSSNSGDDGENNDTPENKNSADDANNDNGPQNKSDNKDGDDDNGTQEQEKTSNVSVMNAQKGDENTQYDEEALAMQRRYREIPEDAGGLLREFIKKEYMKDRYNDENK